MTRALSFVSIPFPSHARSPSQLNLLRSPYRIPPLSLPSFYNLHQMSATHETAIDSLNATILSMQAPCVLRSNQGQLSKTRKEGNVGVHQARRRFPGTRSGLPRIGCAVRLIFEHWVEGIAARRRRAEIAILGFLCLPSVTTQLPPRAGFVLRSHRFVLWNSIGW